MFNGCSNLLTKSEGILKAYSQNMWDYIESNIVQELLVNHMLSKKCFNKKNLVKY